VVGIRVANPHIAVEHLDLVLFDDAHFSGERAFRR
jgi:hypothetical protein